MDKKEIELISNNPELFKEKIEKLLEEYKDYQDGYGFVDMEEAVLIAALPYLLTDEFFKYIYSECDFKFDLFSYFPENLENNQEFVDLVIKYDPSQIFNIPNDSLLNSKHVELFENYLQTKPRARVVMDRFPKVLSNSSIVFEKALDNCFNRRFYRNKFFMELLNVYYMVPDFYKKILKKHSEGNYEVTAENLMFENYNFLCVDEILEYVITKNYRMNIYVPLEKKSKAIDIIAKLIKNNQITFDINQDYMMDYGCVKELITSKVLIDAIFELDDISNYYDFIRYSDVSLYDDEQLERLFEISQENRMLVFPKNANNSPKILSLFLENPNSSFFEKDDTKKWFSFKKFLGYLNKIPQSYEDLFFKFLSTVNEYENITYDFFTSSLWEDKEFTKKLDENGILETIIDDCFFNNNKVDYCSSISGNIIFINKYIDKCIYYLENSKGYSDKLLNALSITKNFRIDMFGAEQLNVLFEYIDLLIDKQLFHENYLPVSCWSSANVLKYFLEKEYCSYLDMFALNTFNNSKITDLLFKKVDFQEFVSKELKNNRLDKVYAEIKLETIEDFNELSNRISDPVIALIFVKKYYSSGLKDENLNYLANYWLNKIKEYLIEEYKNKNAIEILINQILNDTRSVFTPLFVESPVHLIVAINYTDILNDNQSAMIKEDYRFLYENLNKKHINEIINNLIKNYEFDNFTAFDLAIKMYVSIGFERCRDLLNQNANKNYGPIDKEKIIKIFSNVSLDDVILQKQGNGYVPVENKILINLLMGSNYKNKTTPISMYLSDFEVLKQKRDLEIEKINANIELTDEEKKRLINIAYNNYQKLYDQITEFVSDFSKIYNEWDIIEEEFYKEKNKSKLSIKLNVAYCNNAIKRIESMRKMPKLELRDEPLLNSDIFDYVGYDNQYVTEPSLAPARAVMLSRGMEKVKKKKFPNIKLEKDGYSLFVYGPQDRNILSAGYKSGCCFRARGNADNHGQDNSLLKYCTSTEYGGGLEIRNSKGEMVMFSPLLRNGNTLMVHSIETKFSEDKQLMDIIHQLLLEYSNETIKKSYEFGDNIDFVFITDLHYLDTSYTKSALSMDRKFFVYDENESFKGMYTNLDSNHVVLANKNGCTEEDINYGPVDYSYEYPVIRYDNFPPLQLTPEDRNSISNLLRLDDEIILKANERFIAKKNNEFDKSYNLLLEIKKLKKEYLELYKELLASRKYINIFEQYKKATLLINNVNEELGISIDYVISEVYYGIDWYIIITPNKKIIANCLPEGSTKLKSELRKTKDFRPYLINEQEEKSISEGFRI